MYINEKHKREVESRNYIYIGSYKRNEITLDGKNSTAVYVRVKCKYCNNEYDKFIHSIRKNIGCDKCCNKYENSFAYHIQVELGSGLNEYWDWDKNILNPYLIYRNSRNKVFIKCNKKDYHDSYDITCDQFSKGHRCPYCYNQKVHPRDSFGSLYPEKAKYWSDKNKVSPFSVSPHSKNKYWFKCEKCSKDFKIELDKITRKLIVNCKSCNTSKLENKTELILKKYKINYETQKKFKNLLGVGNRNLSYDFYLPDYNILLECQGEFHDGTAHTQSNYDFEIQQEHDRRKFNYAIKHNYIPLEIWYWDYDNIEEILTRELIDV